ncbi:hypothetical protein ADUPG1_005161 [Aduncisulcus paluster]|uniref:Uncharacterized protein n=1 Tax=Aduncisulcus paluster TaxID=2918883 RepID=A0ABQ5K979_9EUKA|nr:hypothetical protein ADUPG1_005161 [Aduncisulcus paluster]
MSFRSFNCSFDGSGSDSAAIIWILSAIEVIRERKSAAVLVEPGMCSISKERVPTSSSSVSTLELDFYRCNGDSCGPFPRGISSPKDNICSK